MTNYEKKVREEGQNAINAMIEDLDLTIEDKLEVRVCSFYDIVE